MKLHCLLFIVSVSAIFGCSDGRPVRVPVAGQVLIDGKPLTCGTITFIPTGHRASNGTIDSTGHFTLSCFGNNDGAVVGKHKIEITSSEMVQATVKRNYVPAKYQSQATSGLTEEITGPRNDLVINLAWDGGKPYDETYISVEGKK